MEDQKWESTAQKYSVKWKSPVIAIDWNKVVV